MEHLNAMNSDLADGKTDLFEESNTTDTKVANTTDATDATKKAEATDAIKTAVKSKKER